MTETELPTYEGVARLYCRVSTQMQSSDGVSLETQKKQLQSYCTFKKYKVEQIYEDAGISGKDVEHRPAFRAMMRDMQKGDYIIVCDMSRFSRNALATLQSMKEITDKGAIFVCLEPSLDSSTAIGKAIMAILAVIADLDRENIRKNVKNNMIRLSKENKLRSKPPFGYRFVAKDQDLQEVPEQQLVIKKIIQLYENGMKLNQISCLLNDEGDNRTLTMNKKSGTNVEKKFYPETVKRILQGYDVPLRNGEIAPVRKSVSSRIKSHHPPNVDSKTTILPLTFSQIPLTPIPSTFVCQPPPQIPPKVQPKKQPTIDDLIFF